MAVTVYTKPSCVQCNATYRALDKAGIEYNKIDITIDPSVYTYLTDVLEASQAPVVVVSDKPFTVDEDGTNFSAEGVTIQDKWTGFNPDKILEYA